MELPNIPQYEPYFGRAVRDALVDYLSTNPWLTEHDKTREFEEQLAKLVGANYASAVNNGTIVIVQTPTPHYYDANLDVTKILTVANSVVNDVDPCWGDYSSSITDPHTV